MSSQEMFDKLTVLLLSHKYRYYIQDMPSISDYDYDRLESNWLFMGINLGIDMDNYPNWIGFDEKHPFASKAIEAVLRVK